MKKNAFIFPVLALLIAGCAGYHVGPTQPKYMEGVKTVAVPSFKNETLTPRLEVLAADSVIRQIQQDGAYAVTTTDKADVILNGQIKEISRSPARSLRGDVLTSTEFKLTVKLSCAITRRETGEVIATKTAEGSTSYFVGTDPNEGERQALPLAIQEAALRLVNMISEGW